VCQKKFRKFLSGHLNPSSLTVYLLGIAKVLYHFDLEKQIDDFDSFWIDGHTQISVSWAKIPSFQEEGRR
jgi:hypothetical protein